MITKTEINGRPIQNCHDSGLRINFSDLSWSYSISLPETVGYGSGSTPLEAIDEKEGEEDEEELDFEFCNGFNHQCRKAYQIAKDHGWHEKPCNDGEVLALIHCEISEALQALRDGNKPDHHCPDFSSLEIELADAIIRIMDYAGERGLNLSLAILEKMKFNKKRPYKHGKNF